MRVLKISAIILATMSFAASPVVACEWGKTAKMKSNITVTEVTKAPAAGNPEIVIATNDQPVNMTVLPKSKIKIAQ
ncbi:hypothetical protein [Roseibium algae]|uniref:Uncharacterized protein n=1 Tax=Roseibium algae TaxID=3123038 RepID=A0ABU8TLY2_9HYPH